MINEYIAVIYEGNKTEKQLFDNIKNIFLNKNIAIKYISFPAGENIYMLYKQLKKDNFDLDLIEILRDYNSEAANILDGITRKRFSQVYLFFDYDGHNNNLGKGEGISSELVLEEMIKKFDNETELGKLYINYPMVESIRDNRDDDFCYRRCTIPISETVNYKHTVSDAPNTFKDSRKYTEDTWKKLSHKSVCKANCIVRDEFSIPKFNVYRDEITQLNIYNKQYKKYIFPYKKIAILNSFPLFLLDYFGYDFWKKMTT